MSQQYTNELPPEMAASLSMSPFSAEQKAAMPDSARELVEAQEAFLCDHPATAIFRIAVDGSLTARGGVVRAAWNGGEIELEGGRRVNIALEGDEVVYPDGTNAWIINGCGKNITKNERGIALVDSLVSNGDQIISTPQATGMLVERDGMPMDESFLARGV